VITIVPKKYPLQKGQIMLKQILLSSTTLLLLSGCVTKEVIHQPIPQPTTQTMPMVLPVVTPESHTFAGETLTATPKVSKLVKQIKSLNSNTAYIDLNANQNIQVGNFLNISATPNQAGYLKLIIIDPDGQRKLVLPNSIHNGFLQANQRFSSNNGQFALQTTKPTGLHYVVVVFSEQNARMVMQQGANGYNTINNDQDFINMLQRIKNQDYGKSHISIFPMRIF
jgi:biopolymer transport protein ExbD